MKFTISKIWIKRIISFICATIVGYLATTRYDEPTGFLAYLILYCYLDTYANLQRIKEEK